MSAFVPRVDPLCPLAAPATAAPIGAQSVVSAGAGTTAGPPPTMSVPFTAPPATSAATKRAMSSVFETWYPAGTTPSGYGSVTGTGIPKR